MNLAAGGAMLIAMLILTPRFGVKGAAFARLLYGPVTWLLYVPLYRRLHPGASDAPALVALAAPEGR
jgi:hypothetical protein